MVLNSNRKNVAKFKAAYCSVCLLLSPSYQLNDVGDVSLVMENVRDGLKSNIISCPKIKEKFLQGLINAKKFVSRPFVSAYNRLGKNNSTGNHTETSKISWIKKLTTPITDIFRTLWYLTDDKQLFRLIPLSKRTIDRMTILRNKMASLDGNGKTLKKTTLIKKGVLSLYDTIYYLAMTRYIREKTIPAQYETDFSELKRFTLDTMKHLCIEQPEEWIKKILRVLNKPEQLNKMDEEARNKIILTTAIYSEPGLLGTLLDGIKRSGPFLFEHDGKTVNSLFMHVMEEIRRNQRDKKEVPNRLIENAKVVLKKLNYEDEIMSSMLEEFDTYYLEGINELQIRELRQLMEHKFKDPKTTSLN